jgi:hypothetical protein
MENNRFNVGDLVEVEFLNKRKVGVVIELDNELDPVIEIDAGYIVEYSSKVKMLNGKRSNILF